MACPPHPYGIKPHGQAYLEPGVPDARPRGLGRLAQLSDELLLGILYELPAADLQRLALASKALYAFCHYDELWKALVLEVRVGGGQLQEVAACGVGSRLQAGRMSTRHCSERKGRAPQDHLVACAATSRRRAS